MRKYEPGALPEKGLGAAGWTSLVPSLPDLGWTCPAHTTDMACALIASPALRRSAARIARSRAISSESVPLTSDTYCLERGDFARVGLLNDI